MSVHKVVRREPLNFQISKNYHVIK